MLQPMRCSKLAFGAARSGLLVFAALSGCSSGPPAPLLPPYTGQLNDAEAALAVGELDQALAGFIGVTHVAAADPRGWEGLALVQLARGEDTAALAAFRELDDRLSEPLAAPLARQRCAAAGREMAASLEVGQIENARSRLAGPAVASCSSEERRRQALGFHLAVAAVEQDGRESQRQYRLALELEPGHEGASLALAARLLSSGSARDAAEAVATLSAALDAHPSSPALIEAMVNALTLRRR